MNAGLFFRAVGTVAIALAGWQVGSETGPASMQPRNAILGIAIGAVIGLVLAPLLVARPYQSLRRLISSMPTVDLVYAIIGLILGLIVAALLAIPLSFLPWWFGHVLPAVAALVFGYLGISALMMRRRELNRFVQGRFEASNGEKSTAQNGYMLVDTSAIIDGRIADICATGFIHSVLLVPRFVLKELQNIADSADPLRRNRGRRGLDVLNRLQKDVHSTVEISDLDAREVSDVDGKLVTLARQMGSPVLTNDFNLNRVAELQGVKVLNINQLANALKPVVIPGEVMSVKVIQEGKEQGQGVAYLDDGTMIVVEGGRRFLGSDVDVVVTRVLQTMAGRMIFAQPKAGLSR